MILSAPLSINEIKEGKLYAEYYHPREDIALVIRVTEYSVLVFHSNSEKVVWNIDAFRSSYRNLK